MTGKIKTKEKYVTRFGITFLELITGVELPSGEFIQVDKRKIKLNVPAYVTKFNLWDHTDVQLRELERLLKANGLKQPNQEILNQWSSWIKESESIA